MLDGSPSVVWIEKVTLVCVNMCEKRNLQFYIENMMLPSILYGWPPSISFRRAKEVKSRIVVHLRIHFE